MKTKEAKKAAYLEGWNVAKANEPASAQPAYPTHEEREAFKEGWHAWWELNAPDRLGAMPAP